MNDNKNSRYFYYVPYGEENYAKVSEISDFSLNGGNAFTLCIGFIESQNSGNLIFSENFSLAFHNGYLNLTASGLAGEDFDVADFIIAKSWNFVTVSYDKTTLKVYINNMLALEKSCTNAEGKAIGSLELGKGFSGYFERILLFSSALSDSEIIKINFASTFDFAKLVFGFIFDSNAPADLGDKKLSIISMGLSDMVNGVPALSAGSGACVANFFSQALESEFTILSKVYLSPTFCDKGYIFSHANGNFALYASIASQVTMFIEFMGETFEVATKFDPYAWMDFAITFKDGLLTFFADGVPHGTFTPKANASSVSGLVIGNEISSGKIGGNNFTGDIDSIAIYFAAKTATQLTEYVEAPPYIFDEYMLEYYDFSYPDFTEHMAGANLAIYGDAKVAIVRNTSSYAENLPAPFYLPTTPLDRSDYRMWELKNLVSVVKEYYSYIIGEPIDYGEYPTSPQWIAAMTLAEKEILPKPEAQLFLAELATAVSLLDENAYTAELRYANLFGGTNKRPFMRLHSATGEVTFTGEGTVMVAGVTDTMAMTYNAEATASAAWITAGASVVLDAVFKQKSNAAPKKSSGDDDKDPVVSEFSATVASLKFYHSNDSSSALNINSSFETANVSPEYSYIGNSQGGIAYAVNYNKNVIIKATIAVKTSSPCTVTLTGYASGVLGKLSCTFQANSSGVYDVGISSNAVFAKLATCKNDVSITWIATSVVGSCIAGTTAHTIYTLPSLPISPFDNTTNLIDCKCLEIALRNSDTTWNSSNIQANIAKNLLTDTRFKGERKITGNFTTTGENGLFFNMKAFQTAIEKNAATITPLDSSTIFSILCRSVGKEMDVVGFKPLFDVIGCDENGNNVLSFVQTNPIMGLAETEFTELDTAISIHFSAAITSVQSNTSDDPFDDRTEVITVGNVFDCFYVVQSDNNSTIKLIDLPYTSAPNTYFVYEKNIKFYREAIMQEYSCCDVEFSYKNIVLTNSDMLKVRRNSSPNSCIVYDFQSRCYTSTSGRPRFPNSTRTALPLAAGQARCHSFSYRSILHCIINALNANANMTTTTTNLLRILFASMAYPTTPEATALVRSVTSLATNLPSRLGEYINASWASAIVYHLNSCIENLRAADQQWNASTSDNYDPLLWVHCGLTSQDGVNYDVDATYNNNQIAQNWNHTSPCSNAFYVYDPTDCFRLSRIRITRYANTSMVTSVDTHPILYSSSNAFALPQNPQVLNHPIYYIDHNTGRWIRF